MSTYDGAAFNSASGAGGSRLEASGQTYPSAPVAWAASPGPANTFGGSTALASAQASPTGWLAAHGDTWTSHPFNPATLLLGGRLEPLGQAWLGRAFALSAVYRNGDRLTLAGYALNQAGQPLHQVQIQFIGQSVQNHFFGSATDLDGIYVAYLDQGDTYTAYAFSPTTGITYRLDSMQVTPNQTNLTFRQVTKRGASGEGLFRQGG